ncbi:MAG TPA: hypothetical protein VLM42_03515, partial [Bryobacteraceae bacterium]|nr:hypothetical protein [Bryobacteraceae bacterium]
AIAMRSSAVVSSVIIADLLKVTCPVTFVPHKQGRARKKSVLKFIEECSPPLGRVSNAVRFTSSLPRSKRHLCITIAV